MTIISEDNPLDKLLPPQDQKDKRKSGYSKTIRTVADLLKNIELRNKCKVILGRDYDLTPNHFYTYEKEEKDMETVLLLEDLGFLKADWTGLKNNQKHRLIGNRLITIAIDGNKAISFLDRISGKKTKISKTALELVAHHLADNKNIDEFFDLLENCGIPKSLFQYGENYPIENEWLIAYDILKLYGSSSRQEDLNVVFRIMEESARPIMFGGDEEKSLEFRDKLSGFLQRIKYCFNDDGKIVKATKKLIENINNRQKKRFRKSNKEKSDTFTNEKDIEKIHLPENVKKWERIVMRLSGENGQGVVMIQVLGDDAFEHKTDFSKLGFGNLKSDSKPKKSWVSFLYVLAMNKGVYPMRDFLPLSQKNKKDQVSQWKKEVKENFINAFGINADPILWDSKGKAYVAKLRIIPPQQDRIDMEHHDEITEEFNRQQKSIAKKK
ncbi:MAG: hypothetical protein WC823_02685 [Parcubacteria group bacterium]|jgi:hypothetical protein